MTQATTYTTSEGDRLDTIAYKAFGNSHQWLDILNANPTLPIQNNYPAGLIISVPIRTSAQVSTDENLPPWRQ